MIDLRSDTVTRPTEAMLESMREAIRPMTRSNMGTAHQKRTAVRAPEEESAAPRF